MNPSDAHVALDIDATDRYRALVDSDADDTHPDAMLHRDCRHPACLIAHLDEKQHALAFEMRDVVSQGANSC